MSLFKEFSNLLPYLQSVRKIENYLSFDVAFSTNWKIPKKFVSEDKIFEQDCTLPEQRLFSFISEITEIDIEKTNINIQNIIKYNLEREEKEKLFDEKVNEVKNLFDSKTLEELKHLNFQFNKKETFKTKKVKLEDDKKELEETSTT